MTRVPVLRGPQKPRLHEIGRCRVCNSIGLETIVSLGMQALTGVFPRIDDAPVAEGPLTLTRCRECNLVQLLHSYEAAELYGAHYGYRSGLNASMVAHLREKIAALTAAFPLQPNDLVIDIGSNDGTTLGFYPENVERVGFDPSAEKFRKFYKPGVKLITDFFGASTFRKAFGKRKARIITSIAMFYDLEEPQKFVDDVASLLADDGIWHFEQSYLPSMLKANAYDTICHEHLEYYGLNQIKRMVERAGLKIVSVELNGTNGGSFAVTAAKERASIPAADDAVQELLREEARMGLHTANGYEQFVRFVRHHQIELRALLHHLKAEGKKVLGYGASTKGNVLLQHCGITTDLLPFMAEVNPDKFGCKTPGSSIPIISEIEAHAMNPHYFLVLPWHFRENIVAREEAFLARGGKLIFPLPQIEIVGE
ncbi:MAG: class I SAM-dependent methyltransferase [Chthoniobacterales bacterium]